MSAFESNFRNEQSQHLMMIVIGLPFVACALASILLAAAVMQ